ncbi:MAG TPA: hypothetical protein VLE51_03110 [Candidatus Saccharimonadales bacterium]|nr:hypothetical protein [Candidatus Saccharimonadales bacterium]
MSKTKKKNRRFKFSRHLKKAKRARFFIGSILILLLLLATFTRLDQAHKKTAANTANNVVAPPDTCAQNNTITFSCYKSELTDITTQNGPQAAFALIKKQYSTVPYIKSQCHQLAHVIGRAAYAKYGNIADAFAHGDQFCWAGYYHGMMEQVADEQGTANFLANLNNICVPIAQKARYSFDHYNCVHGLGHGVMEALDGNLFQSLYACDKITDSWERQSCYGGTFMQNILTVQSPDETVDHSSAYLKADQPMYPCTAISDQYKEQCYLMQTSYALQVENYNFSSVFELCANTSAPYRATCYQSLGRDASGQSVSNKDTTKATCLLGKDFEAESNCVIGAAKDFISYFHSDLQARQLCTSLPSSLQSICSSTVTSYYASF